MSRTPVLLTAAFLGIGLFLSTPAARAANAYLPNGVSPSVSVVDTVSHQLLATIAVGNGPFGVAITPDGAIVLVTNQTDGTVSVIDGFSNTVLATVTVGHQPNAVVVKPDGSSAYVVNGGDSTLSVVDLTRDVVTTTIPLISRVGNVPAGGSANAVITVDGSRVYVMNTSDESVSVIDAMTNRFVTAIDLQVPGEAGLPQNGIAVTPDGKTVIAANAMGFSIIDTATNSIRMNVREGSPGSITISPDSTLAYMTAAGLAVHRTSDGSYQTILSSQINSQTLVFNTSLVVSRDGSKLFFMDPFGNALGEMDTKVGIVDSLTDVSGTRVPFLGSYIGPDAPSSLAAAVLPGGRSVTEGTTATVFATMLNTGSTDLASCSVALPLGGVNGLSFHYQTTDPLTNTLVGQLDTPVTIAAHGSQTFVLSFETASAVSGLSQSLAFGCHGTGFAPITEGVNTVGLLYSATAVPDIIALAATSSGDGIVTVPLSAGAESAFAVASDNNGAPSLIIASVDTGDATLPVTATICQSDPVTAQCLAPPATSISVGFPANATPTFSIFVRATGAVPFAPATSRLFVRFNDSGGTSHGGTSVAVRTVD